MLIVASLGCFAQRNTDPFFETLLDNWTFDTDTNVYLGTKYNYDFGVQLQATSLTGTLDGTWKIYHKMSGVEFDWVLYDATSVDTINAAGYTHIMVGSSFTADSMKFEFLNNNITGGVLDCKIRMYKKR